MLTAIWKKLPFQLRELFFIIRRRISYLLFGRRRNLHQINMGYFEKMADISLVPSFAITLSMRKLFYKYSKIQLYFYSVILRMKKRDQIIVFVNIISIEEYLASIISLRKKFKLSFVIDTYDESLYKRPSWINEGEKWFAPHIANVSSNSGTLIPVGVEPRKWNLNGKPKNLKFSPAPLKGRVLIGPFKITHASRVQLIDFPSNEIVRVVLKRMTPSAYAQLTKSFDFVCCPRGNGLDTHRVWEVLYRGRIPILLRSEHAEYFRNIGLPILLLESFSEVYEFTLEQLAEIASEMNFNPNLIPALDPKYWWRLILSSLECKEGVR